MSCVGWDRLDWDDGVRLVRFLNASLLTVCNRLWTWMCSRTTLMGSESRRLAVFRIAVYALLRYVYNHFVAKLIYSVDVRTAPALHSCRHIFRWYHWKRESTQENWFRPNLERWQCRRRYVHWVCHILLQGHPKQRHVALVCLLDQSRWYLEGCSPAQVCWAISDKRGSITLHHECIHLLVIVLL